MAKIYNEEGNVMQGIQNIQSIKEKQCYSQQELAVNA